MRYAYITKRLAPAGYKAVTKPLACALYYAGYSITLCGSNVNAYHVFQGWCLGCTINKHRYEGVGFERYVGDFLQCLKLGLGKYVVFYVAESILASYKAQE